MQHINTFKGNKARDWGKFLSDLNARLETEQQRQQQLRDERDDLAMLSQSGDDGARDQLAALSTALAESEARLEEIQASMRAVSRTEETVKASIAEDAETRRLAQIRNLCRDLERAAGDLDKSFRTIAERYNKAAAIARELQQQMGRASIQANEAVAKPLRNFERCLASHLPHNVGPAKIDTAPVAMQSLAPDFDTLEPLIRRV